MTKTIFGSLIFILLISACKPHRNDVFLDSNGNEISQTEYRNSNNASWMYKEDKKRIWASLNSGREVAFRGDYEALKSQLEDITNRNFSTSTVFILTYQPKDDLCYGFRDPNKWTKKEMRERTKHFKRKDEVINRENPHIEFVHLYEDGLQLKGNRLLYPDKNLFFKHNLFPESAYCGHSALVKPDGNVIVLNGEHDLIRLARYNDPEVWNTIFQNRPEN